MNNKKLFFILIGLFVLTSCSSKKIYRTETTSGLKVYSKKEPILNDKTGFYKLIDLDGNEYQVKDSLLYKIDPITREE